MSHTQYKHSNWCVAYFHTHTMVNIYKVRDNETSFLSWEEPMWIMVESCLKDFWFYEYSKVEVAKLDDIRHYTPSKKEECIHTISPPWNSKIKWWVYTICATTKLWDTETLHVVKNYKRKSIDMFDIEVLTDILIKNLFPNQVTMYWRTLQHVQISHILYQYLDDKNMLP